MTKKEACALLGISPRTLERRMTSGRYTFTRTGEGQFAELSLTHTDIGLREPTPVPVPVALVPDAAHDVQIRPEYNDEPTDAPTFAERYRANEVPDSAGNYFNGTNPRWPTKGMQTLLGPLEPTTKEKFSCDAHMTFQNRPTTIGTDGELVVSAGEDNHPLNKGRVNVGAQQKPQHPNQSRNDMLKTIFSDIRRGFSR